MSPSLRRHREPGPRLFRRSERESHGRIIETRLGADLRVCHKAVAVAVPGLDHALAAPAVTYRLALLRQTGVERSVANELARPQMHIQLLSGDERSGMGLPERRNS
jgi:hypothetical protein